MPDIGLWLEQFIFKTPCVNVADEANLTALKWF